MLYTPIRYMQICCLYGKWATDMSNVQREKVATRWVKFTNSDEEQRLEVLSERIQRKKEILADALKEVKTIRARAIKRMRRANGKN